jgi:hypothetical protein
MPKSGSVGVSMGVFFRDRVEAVLDTETVFLERVVFGLAVFAPRGRVGFRTVFFDLDFRMVEATI